MVKNLDLWVRARYINQAIHIMEDYVGPPLIISISLTLLSSQDPAGGQVLRGLKVPYRLRCDCGMASYTSWLSPISFVLDALTWYKSQTRLRPIILFSYLQFVVHVPSQSVFGPYWA